MTNTDGLYLFSPGTINNGNFTLELSKNGYNTSSHNITIRGTTSQDFFMTQLAASSVSGVIRDTSGDAPLEGVTVRIISDDGTTKGTTVTNASGQYSFNLGKNGDGDYKISLSKTNYQGKTFNVTVLGATTGADEYLEPMVVEDIPIDAEHFPDDVFRDYISKNIDIDKNGILSVQEIENTTVIDVRNRSIYSLEGIEYFTQLQTLYCFSNKLTTLDLSGCPSLEALACGSNQLTTLDLSGCSSLRTVSCPYNRLTSLDVSSCSSLEYLACYRNRLASLDVSSCSSLQTLYCSDNQLTTLDLSGCSSLRTLYCHNNPLTTLNLSNCPYINSSNLSYDSTKVTVIWPSSTSTALPENSSRASSGGDANINDAAVIVATLPEFQANNKDEYSFDVSLDVEVPTGSTLSFVASSEDLSGIFFDDEGEEIAMPITKTLTHVKVSANFEAGKTYKPVITAMVQEDEEEASNGGCNISALGALIMMMSVGFITKTRHIHRERW